MHQPQEEKEKLSICKILKLSNGETIIGNITTETVSYIDVNMPFKVVLIPQPEQNRLNLSVLKWDPTFDYNFPVRVYKTSIVACAEPTDMMMKNYSELLVGIKNEELKEEKDDVQTNEVFSELEDMMKEILKRSKNTTMH